MRVGYARVSPSDQSPELQLEALRRAGCEKVGASSTRSCSSSMTASGSGRFSLRAARCDAIYRHLEGRSHFGKVVIVAE